MPDRVDLPRSFSLALEATPRDSSGTWETASYAGRCEGNGNNGVTQEEVVETFTHLAFYTGCPSAMTAVTVAKEVFEKK